MRNHIKLGFLFISCLIVLFTPSKVFASSYYISPLGSDQNNGTSDQTPFATFSHALNQLSAGDSLFLLNGTYDQPINVSRSGQTDNPITIKAINKQQAIIDHSSGSEAPNIRASGQNIVIDGLEVKNSDGDCVDLTGQNIVARNLKVNNCHGHGIYTDGQNITIDSNEVFLSNLVNQNKSTQWGSGIKVRIGGENIQISNNIVYHNYGEGIAVTRGSNTTVSSNLVYDNFSVNIYIDNSFDVIVEKNFSYCSDHSDFERNGNASTSFGVEEEYYDGWGAQLNNVTFKNNIGSNCSRGIYYWKSDVPGIGVRNISIIHNTFYNMDVGSIYLESTDNDQGNVIKNNIFYQENGTFGYIEDSASYQISNNYFGPTATPQDWTNLASTSDQTGSINFSNPVFNQVGSFAIMANSIAINHGANLGITSDYFSKTRDSNPDIGASEYQQDDDNIQASSSPSASPLSSPPPTPPIILPDADLNDDGIIDIDDYTILKQELMKQLSSYRADLNKDGWVDLDDYTLLKSQLSLF